MHVLLFLNHACNLRCRYCYNGRKFHRPMSRDTIDRGIDLAFSRGDARLTFFGGEPLLEFDRMVHAVRRARDVARHTGKRLRRFSVTVNGTLLNRDNLAFLRDEGFFLVISLDGGKEASADRVLEDGSAAYDRIREARGF